MNFNELQPWAEERAVLRFLQENKSFPIKTNDLTAIELDSKNRKILCFASSVIQLFGRHNLQEICKKIDPKLIQIIKDVDLCYIEILKNLKKGMHVFFADPILYPNTLKIIHQYCPLGLSEEEIFLPLQKNSYNLLPFLQEALLYFHCPQDLIQEKEQQQIILQQKIIDQLDQKRTLSFRKNPPLYKVYYTKGVYVLNKKIVYLFSVIKKWLSFFPFHQFNIENDPIFNLLNNDLHPNLLVPISYRFSDFFIHCSTKIFELNLDIHLSESLKKSIIDTFKNETIRSDVMFFSGFPDFLTKIDLNQWNRPSQQFLKLVQTFLKFANRYNPSQEIKSNFFHWILILIDIDCSQFQFQGTEESFAIAWSTFTNLELQTSDYFDDPFAWKLFCLLIEDPNRAYWITFLFNFRKILFPNRLGIFYYFFLHHANINSEQFDTGNKNLTKILDEITPSPSLLSEETMLELLNRCFDNSKIILDDERQKANILAKEISETFFFTEQEKLLFYLQLLTECSLTNLDTIHENITQIASTILEAGWSFVDHNPNIYLTFRYASNAFFIEFTKLKQLQKKYVDADRNQFFVSPFLIEEIINQVNQTRFSITTKSICNNDCELFISSLADPLLAMFFPPTQPLLDLFQISGIDQEFKICWQSAHLSTHLGQYKPILKNHSLGVYLNWEVMHQYMHLFFCFFDQNKKTGKSASIRLEIPLNELQGTNQSNFFLFFRLFFSIVFQEQPDLNLIIQSPNYQDQSEWWQKCFYKISQLFKNFDEEMIFPISKSQALWDFAYKIRVAYRNLYLSQYLGLSAENTHSISSTMDKNPISIFCEEAKKGIIYENNTLIPPSLHLLASDLGPYQPDAPPEILPLFIPKFSQSNYIFQLLGINLQIRLENSHIQTFPIYFFVQKPSDLLIREHLETNNASSESLFYKEKGFYITLAIKLELKKIEIPLYYPKKILQNRSNFQTHFNFHNLLLKSRIYREVCVNDPISPQEGTITLT